MNTDKGTRVSMKEVTELSEETKGDIIFTVNNGAIEMLRLGYDGVIYVQGRPAATDLEVVQQFKEFVKCAHSNFIGAKASLAEDEE